MKRILLIITLITIGLGGAFTFLTRNQEWRAFGFVPLSDDYHIKWSLPSEEWAITTSDDGLINGHLIKSEGSKGVIFYCHQRGINLAHTKFPFVAKQLTDLGYDLFLFDYRSCGKSRGHLSEKSLLNDCDEVYQELKKRYPEEKITVYGRSLGGTFATYVASKNNPRKLIIEASFFNMFDVACQAEPLYPKFLVKLALKYSFPTDQWMEQVKCPVAFIHGSSDSIVSLDSSERLKEKVKSATLHVIEGADHDDLYLFDDYHQAVTEVL